MKTSIFRIASLLAVTMALTGCWGTRFVSADADLEEIYVGKTYYEIVEDFGRPDASVSDGMDGTKIAYNAVSLIDTRAAGLYRQYTVRNRATKITGMPVGGITFSFGADMKCYAVDSDFQRNQVKEAKAEKPVKKGDVRQPDPIKPKVPRTIDFPYVKSCSPYAEGAVTIQKIEVEKEYLKIFFQYRVRTPDRRPITNDGIFIMPEVYVEDCATDKQYKLLSNEGITLYPEITTFAHNQGGYDVLLYSLTFEPVAVSTEYINIIEPGHSAYNFFGVDVRTPITTKDELKRIN